MADDADAVVRTVRIAARPETVFGFLVDPNKILQWKGTQALIDQRPGGVYRVNIAGVDIAQGRYVEIVPSRRVVFTWGWEGDEVVPPGSSTVEIDLIPDGNETIVRLTHRGLPADRRASHGEGWEHYLTRLALAASGGDPGPDASVKAGEGRLSRTKSMEVP